MKSVVAGLLGLVMTIPVYADRIATKKNWVLDEVKSGGQTLCVASTSVKENKSNYTLEVHKVKGSTAPVEIIMREIGQLQIGPMAKGLVNNEVTLFNEYAVSGDTKFFWYLPDEIPLVMWAIKANSEFDLRPVYESKVGDIDFSLKGASDIVTLLEKRCNDGNSLVVDRLAVLTDHKAELDANPQAISAESVVRMRELYFAMGATLTEIFKTEADIEKLVNKYRPYIDERNALTSEKQSLENSVIPGIKNDQISTSQRLSRTQARLQELKSLIPQAQKAKTTARANYDRAYNNIAPHMPRHNQLVAELNAASAELDAAENALANVRNEIQQNRYDIQRLSNEASDLEYRIRNLRGDLRYARQELDQATRDYNAYNPQTERQRLLNQSPGYHQKKQQERQLTQQLNQAQTQAQRARQNLVAARQQLGSCKSTAGADCSAQQSRVDQLTQELNQRQAEVNQIQSQLNVVSNEVNRIEDNVNNQVNRESKRLRDIKDRAEDKYNRIDRDLNNSITRHDNIVRVIIPDLRQRNQYLLSRQSSLESEIIYLERKVSAALRDLNAFDASVGYDQLAQKLEQTEAALESATNHLANLENEQSRLTQLEIQDQNRLIQLAEDLKKNQNRLAAVNARIGTLNGILAQFDAAKAPLDQKLNQLNVQLSSQQSSYLALIP